MDYEILKNFGMEIVETHTGYAKLSMEIKESHLNIHGMAHGGVLFTLADTTAGIACMTHDQQCVTLNGNINYIRPAKKGLIYAIAHEAHNGRTTGVYNVEIYDQKDHLLATSSFSMYILKKV